MSDLANMLAVLVAIEFVAILILMICFRDANAEAERRRCAQEAIAHAAGCAISARTMEEFERHANLLRALAGQSCEWRRGD